LFNSLRYPLHALTTIVGRNECYDSQLTTLSMVPRNKRFNIIYHNLSPTATGDTL